MGLLTKLLFFPIAGPVAGIKWSLEKVQNVVEEELTDDAPVKQDYTWYSLKLEKNGFYGRIAGFAQDFEGNYAELGYDFSLAEVDLGIKAILSDDDLTGEADQSMVFTIGKSFDF